MDRCRRCGKPIRVDESVKRGFGPKCWAKIKRGEIGSALLIPTPFQLEPKPKEAEG